MVDHMIILGSPKLDYAMRLPLRTAVEGGNNFWTMAYYPRQTRPDNVDKKIN